MRGRYANMVIPYLLVTGRESPEIGWFLPWLALGVITTHVGSQVTHRIARVTALLAGVWQAGSPIAPAYYLVLT